MMKWAPLCPSTFLNTLSMLNPAMTSFEQSPFHSMCQRSSTAAPFLLSERPLVCIPASKMITILPESTPRADAGLRKIVNV